MKTLSMFLILLVFTGCNNYTTQICRPEFRVDIAGFEGKHSIIFPNTDDFSVKTSTANIQKIGLGNYNSIATLNGVKEDNSIYTCKIDGKIISESYDSSTKSYSTYFINIEKGVISETYATFDKSELDIAKIPYEISKSNPTIKKVLGISFNDSEKVEFPILTVDNSKISEKEIVNLLHPTSMVFKIY